MGTTGLGCSSSFQVHTSILPLLILCSRAVIDSVLRWCQGRCCRRSVIRAGKSPGDPAVVWFIPPGDVVCYWVATRILFLGRVCCYQPGQGALYFGPGSNLAALFAARLATDATPCPLIPACNVNPASHCEFCLQCESCPASFLLCGVRVLVFPCHG